ncbi:MAG TPA: dTMP kinase [Gemmatimonadaceae bacterium]|nr:dTMP kinase [Gemmatimonadaceae bacterium]
MRGRLIVFEGAEGAGKTTQIGRLSIALSALGVPHTAMREPGGTPLGDEIRRLLLDPAREMAPRTEALLFLASRAQLVADELRPRLAAGELLLLDRFVLSTYAYQVAGRGLPEHEVRCANALATASLVPDVTLVLGVPAAERQVRAARRGASDRMERAGAAFHDRVEHAFSAFLEPAWQAAHPECGPLVSVNGAGAEDEVFAQVAEVLARRWPETFARLRGSYPSASPIPRS